MADFPADIRLSDEKYQFDVVVEGGVKGIDERPQVPSNIVLGGRRERFASNDPLFEEEVQYNWQGGRGNKIFRSDPTRFCDSMNCYTQIPERAFNQLLWYFSDGPRVSDEYMPDSNSSVKWIALLGASLYRSVAFTCGANQTSDIGYLFIRRRGRPSTLTFRLHSDDGGTPGTVLKTVTKTVTNITDVVSVFQDFDWTTTQALVATTVYHVSIYGASTDNDVNHWEVGVDEDAGSGSYRSTNGTAWVATTDKMYFRVTDADAVTKWHVFQLDGTDMYAVSEPATGNSVLLKWNETTDVWDAVTLTAGTLTGIVKSVAVVSNMAFFAFGSVTANNKIAHFDNAAGTYNLYYDTGTGSDNKADAICAGVHPTDGPQLVWGINAADAGTTYCIKRADVPVYGANVTVLATTELPKGYSIIGMTSHMNMVWARTTNGLYSIVNDKATSVNEKLASVIETATYQPLLSSDTFLFFPWSYGLERMYGSAIDDVGLWHEEGLPDTRQGVVSCLCGGIGGVYVGLDGGTANTSAVFFYDNRGFHEVWRAYKAGARIRNIFYQPQNGTTNPARLWINCAQDLIYIPQPDQSLNPLNDADSRYVHESVIVSSTHDFGSFSQSKLFEALDIVADGLGSEVSIGVDYQLDEKVGTEGEGSWITIGEYNEATRFRVPMRFGNRNKMRYRLRLMTSDNTKTPKVNAVVVLGFAATLIKRMWTFRIKASDIMMTPTGGMMPRFAVLYNWLRKCANDAKLIYMECPMIQMDKTWVKVQPPAYEPESYNAEEKSYAGSIKITLMEAETREQLAV